MDKVKWLMSSVVAIIVAMGSLSPSYAQQGCSPDQIELIIILPNGNERVICVPQEAAQGLENAADHSPGLIEANACPCFSKTKVDTVAANPTFLFGADSIGDEDSTLLFAVDADPNSFPTQCAAAFVVSPTGVPVELKFPFILDECGVVFPVQAMIPFCREKIGDNTRSVDSITTEQGEACAAIVEPHLPP